DAPPDSALALVDHRHAEGEQRIEPALEELARRGLGPGAAVGTETESLELAFAQAVVGHHLKTLQPWKPPGQARAARIDSRFVPWITERSRTYPDVSLRKKRGCYGLSFVWFWPLK
ncbi:MAG TPA: hypothetical protein PKW66_14370, partial [Polyangiaceae bacterium]|nr:hypothetical protein [Polyangiaceae bacterium]